MTSPPSPPSICAGIRNSSTTAMKMKSSEKGQLVELQSQDTGSLDSEVYVIESCMVSTTNMNDNAIPGIAPDRRSIFAKQTVDTITAVELALRDNESLLHCLERQNKLSVSFESSSERASNSQAMDAATKAEYSSLYSSTSSVFQNSMLKNLLQGQKQMYGTNVSFAHPSIVERMKEIPTSSIAAVIDASTPFQENSSINKTQNDHKPLQELDCEGKPLEKDPQQLDYDIAGIQHDDRNSGCCRTVASKDIDDAANNICERSKTAKHSSYGGVSTDVESATITLPGNSPLLNKVNHVQKTPPTAKAKNAIESRSKKDVVEHHGDIPTTIFALKKGNSSKQKKSKSKNSVPSLLHSVSTPTFVTGGSSKNRIMISARISSDGTDLTVNGIEDYIATTKMYQTEASTLFEILLEERSTCRKVIASSRHGTTSRSNATTCSSSCCNCRHPTSTVTTTGTSTTTSSVNHSISVNTNAAWGDNIHPGDYISSLRTEEVIEPSHALVCNDTSIQNRHQVPFFVSSSTIRKNRHSSHNFPSSRWSSTCSNGTCTCVGMSKRVDSIPKCPEKTKSLYVTPSSTNNFVWKNFVSSYQKKDNVVLEEEENVHGKVSSTGKNSFSKGFHETKSMSLHDLTSSSSSLSRWESRCQLKNDSINQDCLPKYPSRTSMTISNNVVENNDHTTSNATWEKQSASSNNSSKRASQSILKQRLQQQAGMPICKTTVASSSAGTFSREGISSSSVSHRKSFDPTLKNCLSLQSFFGEGSENDSAPTVPKRR